MSSATQIDDQEVLIHFDDNTFEAVTPYQEDFEDQVHEAQEQLQELRHKQEAVERQKAELEELHHKKDDFMRGRTDVSDKLSRCITSLDREAVGEVLLPVVPPGIIGEPLEVDSGPGPPLHIDADL